MKISQLPISTLNTATDYIPIIKSNIYGTYSSYKMKSLSLGNIEDIATNSVVKLGNGSGSSFRIHNNNNSSGSYSGVLSGVNNTASGYASVVMGGSNNVASGSYSTISGGSGSLADKYGQCALSSGYFNTNGDAQTSMFVSRNQTNNTTETELFLDGISQRINIANNTAWAFDVDIISATSGSNNYSEIGRAHV